MAIVYPENRNEIAQNVKTDVQNEIPESNPFLRNSFLLALIYGISGRLFDVYSQIKALQDEAFPDTADDSFLERWGNYKGIDRLAATQSIGQISITGVSGSTVPNQTALQSSSGASYLTQSAITIIDQDISVSSMTRSAQTVTVQTVNDHNFATGMEITHSGADQADYNATFEIVVTSLNTYTFTITTTPVTPATGTILASVSFGFVNVKSSDFGADTNLNSGDQLTITTPLGGVDSTTFVGFVGVTGGVDEESDEDLRNRILDTYANPVALFNVAQIEKIAKEVNGVTRVFVDPITPSVGDVTVLFLMDNKPDTPIPDANEVQEVKDALLAIKPAHMDPDDLIVAAPNPIDVDFDFTLLEPDSDSMREAVTNSLEEMFEESAQVGENLSSYAYTSAIYRTVDPETGLQVSGFNLSTPGGDIAVNDGEIAILGDISWS